MNLALQNNNASYLISTVDSSNLQFLFARENQFVIEEFRAQDRLMWSAPSSGSHLIGDDTMRLIFNEDK